MLKKIETLEDVHEYVKTHYDAISTAWDDMLYDMEEFGEEYTVEDFIEEADMQIALGHISAIDFLQTRKEKEIGNQEEGAVGMKITTDRELEIFDSAYNLGFRAGRLYGLRHALAVIYYSHAVAAGINIAVTRGNISLEEYATVIDDLKEDWKCQTT